MPAKCHKGSTLQGKEARWGSFFCLRKNGCYISVTSVQIGIHKGQWKSIFFVTLWKQIDTWAEKNVTSILAWFLCQLMTELSVCLVICTGFIQFWHGFAFLVDATKLARAHHKAFLVRAMIMPCSIAVCMASELLSRYIPAWHCEDVLDVFSCGVNDCFPRSAISCRDSLIKSTVPQHCQTRLLSVHQCCVRNTPLLLSPEAAAVVILQLLLFVKGNSVWSRLLLMRDSFLVDCRQQKTQDAQYVELSIYLVELMALTEFVNGDNCASLLVPHSVRIHEKSDDWLQKVFLWTWKDCPWRENFRVVIVHGHLCWTEVVFDAKDDPRDGFLRRVVKSTGYWQPLIHKTVLWNPLQLKDVRVIQESFEKLSLTLGAWEIVVLAEDTSLNILELLMRHIFLSTASSIPPCFLQILCHLIKKRDNSLLTESPLQNPLILTLESVAACDTQNSHKFPVYTWL